ncbi:uncharacterized protein TNCV_638521 [Trichonephila clavipes]|nr:uncharacterized protein TNCV_638521 [Trichonephila clavipes]
MRLLWRLENEGVSNTYNFHVWATETPNATSPHVFQQHFYVGVWAGIVNDYLIGSNFLSTRLNGHCYWNFLEILPELLQEVPTGDRNHIWI